MDEPIRLTQSCGDISCEECNKQRQELADLDEQWRAHSQRLAKMLAKTLVERSKAQRERNAAVVLIKELNATKNQHGRHYRARCGKFLETLTAGSPEPPAR